MDTNYKRTVAGSIGAGMGAIFNASGRRYYILEHRTETDFHKRGESQKIIVDEIELGRDANCQVQFGESSDTVSRRHAAIVRDGENWKLIPLSQTNATLVNGQPISGERVLTSGDEIRLSSNGPVLGFIVPQGTASLTNSISFSERMDLFRKQALRPYKAAIAIITIVLVAALAGLGYWIYDSNEKHKEIEDQIVTTQEANKKAEEAAKAAEAAEANWFADLNNCNDAVYYVRMDNLVVYDKHNQEQVAFDTSDIIGGTGFLLEDGRFVTAHRVIEPWYYYKDVIGKDGNGVKWTFMDIQVLVEYDYKIVANFTAYSPSGTNFKFDSRDMSIPSHGNVDGENYNTKLNKTVAGLVGNTNIELKWYNTKHQNDWATMAKKDQLGTVKGLKFDNAASLDPKVKDEVKIVGYPLMEGFNDSSTIKPIVLTNNVNVTGLNDEGIIELASRRYQQGNNGAPVLLNINGLWTVVGVLCETDSADRDVVVPIGYVK